MCNVEGVSLKGFQSFNKILGLFASSFLWPYHRCYITFDKCVSNLNFEQNNYLFIKIVVYFDNSDVLCDL